MSGKGSKPTIFRQLKDGSAKCPLNEQQSFLPLSIINKTITEEAVKESVSGKLWFIRDRKLPGRIVKHAKKIFAILAYIGETGAMKELLSEGLTDEHLPLSAIKDSNELMSGQGKRFSSFARWKTEQRITDFLEKQWMFLAPMVDSSGHHVELEPKCPLPFLKMEEIGSTRTSTVYESELHPAHFKSRAGEKPCCHVATKEIRDGELFNQEKNNLNKIQDLNHSHLVKHFATYQKGTSFYVIFPWASGGSLGDFWERNDGQIRDTSLTMWSLRQMLGLAMALKALHSVNCRHGDLKPANILHFREPEDAQISGKLVIADVGISKTHQKDTQFRHVGTTTRATTPSYEAPEASTNKAPRARRYDIWSIGCIFLEFAIWILHDMEAINSFGYARHAPSFQFYLPNRDPSSSDSVLEIHPMVTLAIERLRQDPRCYGDTIFGSFIDLISTHLLQIEVEQRSPAEELVARLQAVIRRMDKDPGHLFNTVSTCPEKLRFPRRAQTGANDSHFEDIPE